MSRLAIELPPARFSVQAPDELLESLRLFYPRLTRPTREADQRPDFRIEHSNGQWLLSGHEHSIGSFSDPIYALLALEFEIENLVLRSDVETVAFHAGAVVSERGAWIIAGHPDTGKTSSTFQLLELGHAFLCEEIARYDPATGTVHPHLQSLSLDRRFLDEFERLFSITGGEIVPLDPLIARFVPSLLSESPTALEAILLPRYRPDERASIETPEPEALLTEFLAYCFPPHGSEEALFDTVIELLQEIPVYRVTYGDVETARGLLSQLLATHPRRP